MKTYKDLSEIDVRDYADKKSLMCETDEDYNIAARYLWIELFGNQTEELTDNATFTVSYTMYGMPVMCTIHCKYEIQAVGLVLQRMTETQKQFISGLFTVDRIVGNVVTNTVTIEKDNLTDEQEIMFRAALNEYMDSL